MINRVTENMKFGMIANSMYINQGQLGKLEETFSTQKKINRASDDPAGINDILDYRTATNAIQQYQASINNADVSLSIAGTALSALKDVIAQAHTIAISQSGAGASDDNMDTLATMVESLIDEALSLMNTKNDDGYLFAGSSTNTEPFSAIYHSANVGTAAAATTNVFNGTITSGGSYSGTDNKTYGLKIVAGGPLATATYQVSADGGKTWGAVLTDLAAPITLGDGITMTYNSGTQNLASGDLFTVNGYTGGYYNGNDDNMTLQIGKGNNFIYNISGADAFTGATASAAVVTGQEAALTAGDTIVLTRGASSWSLTSNPNYSAMNIVSQNESTINIDADGDAVADIALSISGEWSINNTTAFTITPGTLPSTIPTLGAVSIAGDGKVDLLGTLYALKDALSAHNPDLMDYQTERLQTLETQMLQYETLAGSKRDSLKTTSSNHDSLNLQITNMLSDIENPDMTELIMEFQMKQIAMQASYNMASKISDLTILKYI